VSDPRLSCRRLSHSSLGNLNRASADILGSISEPEVCVPLRASTLHPSFAPVDAYFLSIARILQTHSQGECEVDCYIPQYVLRFLHRTGPLSFSLHLSLDTPSVTIYFTSLTQFLESTCAIASRVRFTQSYVPRRRPLHPLLAEPSFTSPQLETSYPCVVPYFLSSAAYPPLFLRLSRAFSRLIPFLPFFCPSPSLCAWMFSSPTHVRLRRRRRVSTL
jgi:hypothetical protein